MKRFKQTDLDGSSRFFRANLVNCITGVKPAILVGTCSTEGVSNLALFSSVFHLGADPALIGLVLRPLTDFSHSYKNMVSTGRFTINLIGAEYSARAHHTSAKFKDGVSEFEACGFHEEYMDDFPAPFVKESAVRAGARFLREMLLEENGTRIIIGALEEIHVEDALLRGDGNIDPDGFNALATFGLETYLGASVVARYAYAKPDIVPTSQS